MTVLDRVWAIFRIMRVIKPLIAAREVHGVVFRIVLPLNRRFTFQEAGKQMLSRCSQLNVDAANPRSCRQPTSRRDAGRRSNQRVAS